MRKLQFSARGRKRPRPNYRQRKLGLEDVFLSAGLLCAQQNPRRQIARSVRLAPHDSIWPATNLPGVSGRPLKRLLKRQQQAQAPSHLQPAITQPTTQILSARLGVTYLLGHAAAKVETCHHHVADQTQVHHFQHVQTVRAPTRCLAGVPAVFEAENPDETDLRLNVLAL